MLGRAPKGTSARKNIPVSKLLFDALENFARKLNFHWVKVLDPLLHMIPILEARSYKEIIDIIYSENGDYPISALFASDDLSHPEAAAYFKRVKE